MFCKNCGKEIDDNAVVCIGCGCATGVNQVQTSGKSFVAALLLCLFFGGIGVHRFYVGKNGTGLTMLLLTLLTLGFGAVITGPWALIDLIMIITGSFKDANGEPLVK